MRGYLALVERQKSTGRGDAVGAEANELLGGAKKFVEQSLGLVADDATRRCAGHDLVKNRKRPGPGIAHITRDARKPGLEDQDADPGAVKRLAAMRDPRCLGHVIRAIRRRQRWHSRLPICCFPAILVKAAPERQDPPA